VIPERVKFLITYLNRSSTSRGDTRTLEFRRRWLDRYSNAEKSWWYMNILGLNSIFCFTIFQNVITLWREVRKTMVIHGYFDLQVNRWNRIVFEIWKPTVIRGYSKYNDSSLSSIQSSERHVMHKNLTDYYDLRKQSHAIFIYIYHYLRKSSNYIFSPTSFTLRSYFTACTYIHNNELELYSFSITNRNFIRFQ